MLMRLIRWYLLVPYVAFALAFVCFVLRSRTGVVAKVVWTLVLAVCCAKFLVFRQFGGHPYYPNFSEPTIWTWCWAYAGAVLLALLSALAWAWRSPKKTLVLPLVAWGLSAVGLWNGVSAPEVRTLELAFPNLPARLDGYRIVHISDLHCSSGARRWRTAEIVRRANAQNPDLVCLTGDNADGRCGDFAADLEPLRDLRAKDGVWAVTGNHEYFYDWRNWRAKYAEWGVRFLENASVSPRPGLVLGGVNDVRVNHRGRSFGKDPDVSAAFAGTPRDAFRILLQHRPGRVRRSVARDGVSLQLSGHTHGGITPGLRSVVALANEGFVRGVYEIGDARLVVSSGAGQWAGFPMRFLTPSEIVVITLRKAH